MLHSNSLYRKNKFLGVFMIILTSCIGTDVLDDPKVEPQLTVTPMQVSLLVDEMKQLEYSYKNEFGVDDGSVPLWVSNNNMIVTVSTGGMLTAMAKGQTTAKAMIDGIESNSIMVTVGDIDTDIAQVNIYQDIIADPPDLRIEIGETMQLIAEAVDFSGMEVIVNDFQWEVDNEQVAQIDNNGLVTGVGLGTVEITAMANGISSMPFRINVGTEIKTGTFVGASGYTAQGMATLQYDINDNLQLILSSDFTTSFALGTFIYLSNSTSGSDTRAGGIEIAEITTNGAATFNISQLYPAVMLNDYRYVIVLCKPASITFGYCDLN